MQCQAESSELESQAIDLLQPLSRRCQSLTGLLSKVQTFVCKLAARFELAAARLQGEHRANQRFDSHRANRFNIATASVGLSKQRLPYLAFDTKNLLKRGNDFN